MGGLVTMAPGSGERHSLWEEGQQPLGVAVETPLGSAPGTKEAVGPHPGWELMWTGGRSLWGQGFPAPPETLRRGQGGSGDKGPGRELGAAESPGEGGAGPSAGGALWAQPSWSGGGLEETLVQRWPSRGPLGALHRGAARKALSGGLAASAALGPRRPSHALGGDSVGAGRGRQVGGEDHPQGAGGVARRGTGVLRAPVGHQPHQQLVGPGHPEGWRDPRLPGPGGGQAGHSAPRPRRPPPCPGPAHPGGPGAVPLSSTTSVTWKATPGSAEGRRPRPPRSRRGGGKGAHLVDAQHGAPVGGAQLAQCGPQRLQEPGPGCPGRPLRLTAERGCHRVDDQKAGHSPGQQHRHLLAHTRQQGVLGPREVAFTFHATRISLCLVLRDPRPLGAITETWPLPPSAAPRQADTGCTRVRRRQACGWAEGQGWAVPWLDTEQWTARGGLGVGGAGGPWASPAILWP